MTEKQFFKQLQEKTDRVFKNSEVYSKNKDKNWYYSICNGPIYSKKPIVFGLNWGVSQDKDFEGHQAQTSYPSIIDNDTWPFKTHVNHYLLKYFGYTFDEVNYSNLCFFRTPNTDYLSYQDWRDAIPLFKEYVEYINPPYLIMMGAPKYLNEQELSSIENHGVLPEGKNRRSFVRTGVLFYKFKFGSVPHSAAHISPNTHDILWKILKEKFK
ncbi:hypothetical protein FGF1_14180 [Flavobacteriaceae bacterium GF1]